MTEAFNISVSTSAEGAEIAVEGELDFHSAPELRERIVDLISHGTTNIVVDVSRLEFIDSSGLGVLVAAYNRLDEAQGTLLLRSPSAQTKRVLEISGLHNLLPIAQ